MRVGGRKARLRRAVGDGRHGRDGRAPVRVQSHVLRAAVAEFSSGRELLSCVRGDGSISRRDCNRVESARSDRERGRSFHTECRGRYRCLTGFLCVDDARAASHGELRLGGFPTDRGENGSATVTVSAGGCKFHRSSLGDSRIRGRNRDRDQVHNRNRECGGLTLGSQLRLYGSGAHDETAGEARGTDGRDGRVGRFPQHQLSDVLRGGVTERAGGSELLGRSDRHGGVERSDCERDESGAGYRNGRGASDGAGSCAQSGVAPSNGDAQTGCTYSQYVGRSRGPLD